MIKQERKKLRLADYEYSQPGAYFVTVCTKNKACILSTIVGIDDHIDPYPQLTHIGSVCDKYLREIPGIGSYVIMPNHIHMMLHISADIPGDGPMWSSAPTKTNISSMIRSWKTLVTKEIGESIWQRSFYDHIIRNEEYYYLRVRYIEENPRKWFFDDSYV